MVFHDIGNSFELNQLNQKKSVADVMDRFFSFLIDYLVISPFVLFLLYSTFNNGFNFWKQHPAAPENELFVIIFSIGFVIYFCLLQSLFIALWRATPGQYFLKVRIDFHESEDLIFLRAMLRQISFWLSFLLLGVPFLAIMTTMRRRTFYDRIGDVSVVSTKNEKSRTSFDSEFRYWQSFMATLIVFVGFLFSALIWKNYSKIVVRSASFAFLKEKRYFCEELEKVTLEQRLEVAVALNFAGQLSDACLDREADFVLWKQKVSDYSLAYYAKSLTAEDSTQEKNYLNQACAGQNTEEFSGLSVGCQIAFSTLTGETGRLYDELNGEGFLNDAMKYEMGLVLGKTEDLKTNFARLEKYNSLKLIKKYQIIEILTQNLNAKEGPERGPASSQPTGGSQHDKLLDLIEAL